MIMVNVIIDQIRIVEKITNSEIYNSITEVRGQLQ